MNIYEKNKAAQPKPVRVVADLDGQLVNQIDEWSANAGAVSRVESIRALLGRALEMENAQT